MDERAQISVEYLLFVAIVLAIVLLFGMIVTDQSEQNNVATATKLGASNGTANLIFFNTTTEPVKVTTFNMTDGTNIDISIGLSRPVSNQQQASILKSAELSLISSGFNVANNGNSLTVTTSRHSYTIRIIEP